MGKVVSIVTGNAINLTINGSLKVLDRSHHNYEEIVKIIRRSQISFVYSRII